MQEKDYKKIAEIIKETVKPAKFTKRDLAVKYLNVLAHNLADYFEKEKIKESERIKECKKEIPNYSNIVLYQDFNKEQFLKDCGVCLTTNPLEDIEQETDLRERLGRADTIDNLPTMDIEEVE